MQWDLEVKAKGTSDDVWRDVTSGREIWTDAYTTDQWTLSCKFSGIQFYVLQYWMTWGMAQSNNTQLNQRKVRENFYSPHSWRLLQLCRSKRGRKQTILLSPFYPLLHLFLSSSEDSQEICWTTIIYAVEVTLIHTNISNLTVWNNIVHKTPPQWINSFLVMSLLQ